MDKPPGRVGEASLTTAIIPAWNEEDTVADTVKAVLGMSGIDEVLVVDDGSDDRTAERARHSGARVVSLPQNVGKGGALTAGLAAARGSVILLVDADLGFRARELGRLLHPVLAGEVDMAIARFPRAARPGGVGLVKGLARLGIQRLTGLQVVSPLSGQRAVRREVLDRVGGVAPGWGAEVALTIDAARAGFRVMEVPVPLSHRETGRNWAGFRHRGRQLAGVVSALVRRWRKVEPV